MFVDSRTGRFRSISYSEGHINCQYSNKNVINIIAVLIMQRNYQLF